MIRSFDLEPLDARDERLRFSWNPVTGEVAGPGASFILERIQGDGFVSCHPVPFHWKLSNEPMRCITDMAAIVGFHYKLPEELQAHYPKPDDSPDDNDCPDTVY